MKGLGSRHIGVHIMKRRGFFTVMLGLILFVSHANALAVLPSGAIALVIVSFEPIQSTAPLHL